MYLSARRSTEAFPNMIKKCNNSYTLLLELGMKFGIDYSNQDAIHWKKLARLVLFHPQTELSYENNFKAFFVQHC